MSARILVGDALEQLRTLPDESVQCCVTSPPYWGLRDYGTGSWAGGDPGCDHRQQLGGEGSASAKQNTSAGTQTLAYWDVCGKCGATRTDRQLGLEPTPDEYIGKMVEVFREVRRVLRTDGTLWLNMGDSYAGSWGNQGRTLERGTQRPINGEMLQPVLDGRYPDKGSNTGACPPGLKPKDLVGQPWRLAFALQADGWWLRSDIIWHKPNPMPESVTDRPTKSHEYLFLLSKAARYYYDAEAIAEPIARVWDETNGGSWRHGVGDAARVAERGSAGTHSGPYPLPNENGNRNARTVWTIATAPFPDAHFATFPPELPRRCILAGTKPGDTVLDPFAGAGTTLLVADRLNRHAIGIELNPKYAEMARRRLTDDAPLFAEVHSNGTPEPVAFPTVELFP